MRLSNVWRSAAAAGAVVLCTSCTGTRLASRPLCDYEAGWASAVERWYPGWHTPYLSPVQPGNRPDSVPQVAPLFPATLDRAAIPMGPLAPSETEEVEIVPAVPGGSPR